MICLCFCMSEVISSFRSLRAGSKVFSLRMLFLCSVQSLQLLCIFPFDMLCLSAISTMFVISTRPLLHGGHLLNKFGFYRINTGITHLFVLCLLDINSFIISELPGTDFLLQYIITVLYFERFIFKFFICTLCYIQLS